MKLLLLNLLILTSLQAFASQKLICWKNGDAAAPIKGYHGDINGETLDYKNRRSFVLNFDGPSGFYGWEEAKLIEEIFYDEEDTFSGWSTEDNSNYLTVGWSYTECEDMAYLSFKKSELENILDGKNKKGIVGVHIGTDSYELNHVKAEIFCMRLFKKNHNRPVFNVGNIEGDSQDIEYTEEE